MDLIDKYMDKVLPKNSIEYHARKLNKILNEEVVPELENLKHKSIDESLITEIKHKIEQAIQEYQNDITFTVVHNFGYMHVFFTYKTEAGKTLLEITEKLRQKTPVS